MRQFEDKFQLIDASSTRRDASQHRDRRRVARLNRVNQASQLEATIANFGNTMLELEGWIEAERSRPGIHYVSTLANSLTQRRDTLERSIEELKRKLAETRSFATDPPGMGAALAAPAPEPTAEVERSAAKTKPPAMFRTSTYLMKKAMVPLRTTWLIPA
jgi:hypothetical protein